jgi:DnaJ-domain-containing protein 1
MMRRNIFTTALDELLLALAGVDGRPWLSPPRASRKPTRKKPRSPQAAPDLSDPYVVLGLWPGAPLVTCEAAYRALVKLVHPDAGGDPAAFRRLTAAIQGIRKRRVP